MSTKTTCPKCSGTGVVPFANKGGVCFECGGNGEVAATASPRRGVSPLRAARTLSDAAIASGDRDAAVAALAAYDDIARTQWATSDYDRRNALLPLISA